MHSSLLQCRLQKEKEDAEQKERLRIREIKLYRDQEIKMAEVKHSVELNIEKMKIREMADKKEVRLCLFMFAECCI